MVTKRCSKCKAIYPDDMKTCPSCGASNTVENSKNISSHYDSPKYNSVMLINCSVCKKEISEQAEVCPHCGQPTGVHVCPKCKSTNTKVISGASKAVSVAMWGIFAANKVKSNYQCNQCGHKF